LTEEDFKKGDQRWKNGNNEDIKGISRKEQVAISRLNRVYEGHPRPQDGRG
jgi:hypothetical protein